MMGIIARLACAALAAATLAGCASDPIDYSEMPRKPGRSVAQDTGQKPQQCVPYARAHSGIKIFGDAYTWWDNAAGKYPRGATPSAGAVMVLHDYAAADRGHVAVVRALVNPREIRVDHANWLDDGAIYVNDPVMDVSAAGDWSLVRVFNIKTGGWGSKVYPVRGFIGTGDTAPGPQDDGSDRVAEAGGGMGQVSLGASE